MVKGCWEEGWGKKRKIWDVRMEGEENLGNGLSFFLCGQKKQRQVHISISIKCEKYQLAGKHITHFESDLFQTCQFWQRKAEDSGSELNGGSWQTDVRHARSQMTPPGFPLQKGLTRVKQNLTGERATEWVEEEWAGVRGGVERKGWSERNVITQSCSLG